MSLWLTLLWSSVEFPRLLAAKEVLGLKALGEESGRSRGFRGQGEWGSGRERVRVVASRETDERATDMEENGGKTPRQLRWEPSQKKSPKTTHEWSLWGHDKPQAQEGPPRTRSTR